VVLVAPTVRALVAAGAADALFRCEAEGWDVEDRAAQKGDAERASQD